MGKRTRAPFGGDKETGPNCIGDRISRLVNRYKASNPLVVSNNIIDKGSDSLVIVSPHNDRQGVMYVIT